MRAERAAALNKRGRVLKPLEVGNYVKIYAPPSHEEALRRKRKAKHIHQFRGPLKILSKPSATTLVLGDHHNPKRHYRRHISNVRRWIGPLPDPAVASAAGVPPPLGTEDIEVDSFIVATDTATSNDLYLLRVSDIDDSEIRVWCHGSGSANQDTAKFKPVYTSSKNGKETVHLGKPREAGAAPFTWAIPIAAVTDLVRLTGIALLASGVLTADSRTRVQKLRPATLHRFC